MGKGTRWLWVGLGGGGRKGKGPPSDPQTRRLLDRRARPLL